MRLAFIVICIFFYVTTSYANDLFEERLRYLKQKYKTKYSERNLINYALCWRPKPCSVESDTCLVDDFSTYEKYNSTNKLVPGAPSCIKKLNNTHPGLGCNNGYCGGMFTALELISEYDNNPTFRSLLTPLMKRIVEDIRVACNKYDYCKKQPKNSATINFSLISGTLTFFVPYGDKHSKLGKHYTFLIPFDKAKKLKDIF